MNYIEDSLKLHNICTKNKDSRSNLCS